MGVGQRAKNTASAKGGCKADAGANLVELPAEGDYMEGDLDKVIENFEDILRDLLKATPPPTEKLLTDAMNLVFGACRKIRDEEFLLCSLCDVFLISERRRAPLRARRLQMQPTASCRS